MAYLPLGNASRRVAGRFGQGICFSDVWSASGRGSRERRLTRHLAYRIAQQVLEEHDYQTRDERVPRCTQEAVMGILLSRRRDAARNLIASLRWSPMPTGWPTPDGCAGDLQYRAAE